MRAVDSEFSGDFCMVRKEKMIGFFNDCLWYVNRNLWLYAIVIPISDRCLFFHT